jgi:hypothetical protein
MRYVLNCPLCSARVVDHAGIPTKVQHLMRLVCPRCPASMQAFVYFDAPKGPNELVAHPRRAGDDRRPR